MLSNMDELLDAVTVLVSLVSPEKVKGVVARVRRTEASKAITDLAGVLGTPFASTIVDRLATAWQNTIVSSNELALMLLTASHVHMKTTSEQSAELVWTGPVTPFVSARRTEQALLEVISTAKKSLFITSFVAYKVPSILSALSESAARGVRIAFLLESAKSFGGSLEVDLIAATKKSLPACEFFYWAVKDHGFEDGKVHAKIAIADEEICLITSANITQYAMEKNIEVGVLLRGGTYVKNLAKHLWTLIDLGIVQEV